MIIIENKFTFIHIPRTSGTSFTKIISQHVSTEKEKYDNGPGWQGTHHFNDGKHKGQHTSINDLNHKDLFLIKELPIITIVRNPYSWIVSIYKTFYDKSRWSFKEYISILHDDVKNHPERRFGHYGTFGKLLQNDYIKNNCHYKVLIYKFEENPHETICSHYNIEYVEHMLDRYGMPFSKENEKKISSYYDDETISFVNEIFEEDFKCLNYEMVSKASELTF